MESYPSKEVENLREKLVEENFYLITEVFLSLRFDGDIGKDEIEEKEVNQRGINIGKNEEVPKQLPVSNKKKTRHELISKARQEAIMAGYFKTLFHLNPGGIQPHPSATCDRESLLRPHESMLCVALDYGTMAHQRSSLCPAMSSPPSAMGSKGSKSGASSRCAGCQCSGFKVQIRQLGPGMIQQMQHPCNECKGSGETISDKDRCPQCKGDKVVSEKKVFEVVVEKGMQNGHKITFPGEADEAPDTATGDIIFVLQQKEHPKFKRKGDDLFYEHTLTLIESLCSFQFVLTHMDNRQMLIKLNHGEVVKPDSFKAINDEGMPMYQRPFIKGKLYIHFSVEFSDSLSPEQCKALEVVLPPKPVSQYTDMELDECEDTMPYDVNIEEEMRRRQQQHQEAYDEDDNVPGGGQRVQCAQQ
ncbi:DnaJ 2 [Zea mays]|uniref:DnaJ 2 n=1 Tax=Zea mays TaxID=4577 RepID=A0A3L6DHJ7_MAIZE|nr:DnaJ 2 [Zea mays]